MLLAREGDVVAVDGVPTNHIDDLIVFVRGRPEGATSCGYVIEEVLYGDLCALSPSRGLRLGRLAGFGGGQLATVIMGPPGAVGIFGLSGHSKVGNVAYAGQGFASEAVGCNRVQVLELLQLGRGEALTQDGQVLFLQGRKC